jgi:hypothetical protein
LLWQDVKPVHDITEQARAMALRGVPQGYSVTFRYVA